MRLTIDTGDIESYRTFLRVKSLPRYRFNGRVAEFPDEYAQAVGLKAARQRRPPDDAPAFLFDYQRDIVRLALRKERFAVFADCGLGKSLILLEYARRVGEAHTGLRLVVSPLMVVEQTMREARRFYGDSLPVERVRAADLQDWLRGSRMALGFTHYEAIREGLTPGRLGCLILDESSMLKSHYGAWGSRLLGLGAGLRWKLCLTGTPAPNDRIEYANHAVFLDRFPNVNSFLATYFVNRGQTENRWELKPHALRPFYRSLSDWCVFLADPSTYGWKDNVGTIPPIRVHVHDVPLTDQQRRLVSGVTGDLYGSPGGITSRLRLSQLAKGRRGGEDVPTNKFVFVRDLVRSFAGESCIVWCEFNDEQAKLEQLLPDAASVKGDTPEDERRALVAAFQSGERKTLISKPKVLGFGLNLQVATRQVFSGLRDSYESYYQAVKRSNRVGSTKPLDVHIPVTEIERAMIETVLAKAARVEQDTREQEAIFKEAGCLTF